MMIQESNSTLKQVFDGVWIASSPIKILGMNLTTTMTVLRLADDKLLVNSPIPLAPQLQEEVSQLGEVTHLYSPNLFHHLYIGDWSESFPDAKLHAPKGLEKKRADLIIDKYHLDEEPDFEGVIEEYPIHGFRLIETALLYKPTGTLLVSDLVHNVGRPEGGWTKFYTKMMGFYDKVAISNMIKWTSFNDKKAAKRSVQTILEQDFDSLIVGHGSPILSNAKETLSKALSWLV